MKKKKKKNQALKLMDRRTDGCQSGVWEWRVCVEVRRDGMGKRKRENSRKKREQGLEQKRGGGRGRMKRKK